MCPKVTHMIQDKDLGPRSSEPNASFIPLCCKIFSHFKFIIYHSSECHVIEAFGRKGNIYTQKENENLKMCLFINHVFIVYWFYAKYCSSVEPLFENLIQRHIVHHWASQPQLWSASLLLAFIIFLTQQSISYESYCSQMKSRIRYYWGDGRGGM